MSSVYDIYRMINLVKNGIKKDNGLTKIINNNRQTGLIRKKRRISYFCERILTKDMNANMSTFKQESIIIGDYLLYLNEIIRGIDELRFKIKLLMKKRLSLNLLPRIWR